MPRPEPEYPLDPRPRPGASSTRPGRLVEPRARAPHGGAQRESYDEDGTLPELPTLGEIEQRIMRCDDELERLVEEHYSAGEQRAMAEADWKAHRDRCLLLVANAGPENEQLSAYGKSQDLREAYAKMATVSGGTKTGEDLYRTYKILEAHETSVDRQIRAIQTRATALMSVARGIRQASGLG